MPDEPTTAAEQWEAWVDRVRCPKCHHSSGDDWRQCKGHCPFKVSPHFDPFISDAWVSLTEISNQGDITNG